MTNWPKLIEENADPELPFEAYPVSADESTLRELVNLASAKLRVALPEDYISFLRTFNGGEGFLGDEFVQIYSAETSMLWIDNARSSRLAQCFVFGGNGSLEQFLLYDVGDHKHRYFVAPNIEMTFERALWFNARSFSDFLVEIRRGIPFG